MFYLKDAGFTGDQSHIAEIIQNFSDVYLGDGVNGRPFTFTVKKFQNWYKDNEGKKPLYFIVPDQIIYKIWPDNLKKYSEIKYGTAIKDGQPITSGLVLHLENRAGLYICLNPDGIILENNDNFGI